MQHAFVEKRQILDVILIANEAIDSRLKGNSRWIIYKLDIEYNHINWSFVFAVLDKLGFGSKWISWIRWCISIVRFSILINGSPSSFFQNSKGLRQGDPLSPYQFIMAREAFSHILIKAKEKGREGGRERRFTEGLLVRGRVKSRGGGLPFVICEWYPHSLWC